MSRSNQQDSEASRRGDSDRGESDRVWQARYHLLEIEHAAQARELEAARAEIQAMRQSRIWRLAASLRWLVASLIRTKQALGRLATSTAAGRALRARLRGKVNRRTFRAKVEQDAAKKMRREQAEQALAAFLDSGKHLSLPSSERPRVSILLVLYNQAPLSLLCLRSLVAHCHLPVELIIVDNASNDKTGALLKQLDGAKLLINDENLGFVRAVNQAAALASGDHLLLLNNDAMLRAGTIEAAVTLLESAPDIGAVGGRIVLLDGTLQEAGSIIWNDGNCLGYGRGQHPELPEFMFQRDVDYCSGAFLLTPRQLFVAQGGLDEEFAPAYYEETDYCVRLRQAGYRTVYEPQAVIEHYEFASSASMASATSLQQQHRQLFREKHARFLEHQFAPGDEQLLEARFAGSQAEKRRPKMLVLDDRVPHASLGAGYPRCRELLHALDALGMRLSFLPLQTIEDDWSAVYKTLPRRIEVLLEIGADGLRKFLRQRRGYYDVVLVSRSHNMAVLAALLRRQPDLLGDARLIYDAEAITATREIQRLAIAGRSVSERRQQRMIDREMAMATGVDAIVTVSEAEAQHYRRAGHGQVHVLGHGIAPALTEAAFPERRGFLFVGALRHADSPNVDSLRWFVEQVMPRIRERLDDAVLYVVGDADLPVRRKLAGAPVSFLGRLDSIEAVYNQARVFVAPTRFAAGIPHKVHEAAAFGVPVVATSLLARQLGWTNEAELLVADQAEDFAEACLRLHQDGECWEGRRICAAQALERDCSPGAFSRRVAEIIQG